MRLANPRIIGKFQAGTVKKAQLKKHIKNHKVKKGDRQIKEIENRIMHFEDNILEK